MAQKVRVVWALLSAVSALECPSEGDFWASGTLDDTAAEAKGQQVCDANPHCASKTFRYLSAAVDTGPTNLAAEATGSESFCVAANGDFRWVNGNTLTLSDNGDCYFQLAGKHTSTIFGGASADMICMGGGNDQNIQGGGGNDVIHAGGGNDGNFKGQEGDDVLHTGDGGNFNFFGNDGDDTMHGGPGRDSYLYGGDGSDTIHVGHGGVEDEALYDSDSDQDTVVDHGGGLYRTSIHGDFSEDNFVTAAEYASSQSSASSGSEGDPHLHLAHGGRTDFRGENGTYYALLSAPGVQLAAMALDTDHLLPRPQLVHGSFFVGVAWTVRGRSGRVYGVAHDARRVHFDVFDLVDGGPPRPRAAREGVWKEWWEDGVRVYMKQATLYVRANGWEANATRVPIYNHVAGPSRWRLDLSLRPLDGTTGFEGRHGNASATCHPHGLIGQSWDADALAVDGALDDYKYDVRAPVVTTKAMAEGAIEGNATEYALWSAGGADADARFATAFKYSRFDRAPHDACATRNVSALTGHKRPAAASALARLGLKGKEGKAAAAIPFVVGNRDDPALIGADAA